MDEMAAEWKKAEGSGAPPLRSTESFLRRGTVDWMIRVSRLLKLDEHALHLAVHIFDRYQAHTQAMRRDVLPTESHAWKMLACCCISLAAKYNSKNRPSMFVGTLLCSLDVRVSAHDILQLERKVAVALQCCFTVPSSLMFSQMILDYSPNEWTKNPDASKYLCHMTDFLLNVALVDARFMVHPPSLVAAAAVFIARCVTHIHVGEMRQLKAIDAVVAQASDTIVRLGHSSDSICACTDELLYAAMDMSSYVFSSDRKMAVSEKFASRDKCYVATFDFTIIMKTN